jgi:hypothetical protein
MAEEFIEKTPQVGFVKVPFGTSRRDLEVFLRMNAEQFRKLYPEVKYFKLNRIKTKVDDLYQESLGDPIYDGIPQWDGVIVGRPIMVPGLLIPGPQMKLLKRYGIEIEHEAICVMCNRVNAEIGIEPVTGDRLEFLGTYWEVLKTEFVDLFINSQVPLNLVLSLKNANPR